MPIVVSRLAVTAVKGTRLQTVDQVELTRDGARGDRRFFVVDERDRMVNGKVVGELTCVVANYDEARRHLRLAFPDGQVVEGVADTGETISARFFSRTVDTELIVGPWADALSEYTGRPVRLAVAESSVDRGRRGAVSLISRASIDRLAEVADAGEVDARRFRMLFEISGVPAHAEDAWVGRTARIGEAIVRFNGHVGRCLITSRDPESGEIDLPTLDILGSYRGDLETTEPLPFGVYGEVIGSGVVRIGDPVVPGE